jgi:hypothetical protein
LTWPSKVWKAEKEGYFLPSKKLGESFVSQSDFKDLELDLVS